MSGVVLPKGAMQILPNQKLPAPLYFLVAPENFSPPSSTTTLYLCTDESLQYTSFFADFGPLDLGLTYKFCKSLATLMAEAQKTNKSVVYYCKDDEARHYRTNSAVLLCAYLVLVCNFSAEIAYQPFFGMSVPFTPYRDAAFATNTWPLFVMDCCMAFARAVQQGHFDYKTFDLNRYVTLQQLHNGDCSWVVEGKLLAFSGPLSKRRELASGRFTMIPEDYVPLFKQLGVTCVVRFNNKCYDRAIFERNGIRHVDLFYEDGGNPTEEILQAFLQLCETQPGGIAVHCKAGLGRTGTNICAYMVKHLGYSVRESIAWHRICRPGAIVGPQQQFLCSIEDKLKSEGNAFRVRKALEKEKKKAASASMVTPDVSPRPSTKQRVGDGGLLPRAVTPQSRHGSSSRSKPSSRSGKGKKSASSSKAVSGGAATATAAIGGLTISSKNAG
jgi:cell division cycle 14